MTKIEILNTAYNMLGDGTGGEWGLNPEYTRAVVEFVMETVGIPDEIVDPGGDHRDPFVFGMIYAAHLLTTVTK